MAVKGPKTLNVSPIAQSGRPGGPAPAPSRSRPAKGGFTPASAEAQAWSVRKDAAAVPPAVGSQPEGFDEAPRAPRPPNALAGVSATTEAVALHPSFQGSTVALGADEALGIVDWSPSARGRPLSIVEQSKPVLPIKASSPTTEAPSRQSSPEQTKAAMSGLMSAVKALYEFAGK